MPQNLIPATDTPLHDLLTRAAFAPLPNIGWLRVTGSDRVRWLNGMVTNNIAALKPGDGCYNFFLNAQGRIQGDCTAWMQEDSILLETSSPGSLATQLDHFIIMDDIELEVAESGDLDRKWFAENEPRFPHLRVRAGLLLAGPDAPSYLHALSLPAPPIPGLLIHSERHAQTDVLHTYSPLFPTFEIWSEPDTIAELTGKLREMHEAPAEVTPEALEQLRILSGTPLYGTDIRNSDTAKDLPQETNQTRALHFSKGCYLGQEIVERIRSRGAVHRTFTGFLLSGEPATPGTILTAEDKPDKPIGELTSVTAVPSELLAHNSKLESPAVRQIALGYLRREALDRNASITYPGGTATPVTLPFQLTESRPEHA